MVCRPWAKHGCGWHERRAFRTKTVSKCILSERFPNAYYRQVSNNVRIGNFYLKDEHELKWKVDANIELLSKAHLKCARVAEKVFQMKNDDKVNNSAVFPYPAGSIFNFLLLPQFQKKVRWKVLTTQTNIRLYSICNSLRTINPKKHRLGWSYKQKPVWKQLCKSTCS